MTTPQAIEVSVLRWAPPVVHGLVRDIRVRWALEEAGLPYRERVLSPEDQKSASYRELQPFGQVPAFRSGDEKLFESGAIVLHIAEQCPALMPAAKRTEVMTWVFGTLTSLEPPMTMLQVFDFVYQGPKGDDVAGMREWVAGWMGSRLDTLAQKLEGKEYLLGPFTAADLLLTTVLRGLRHTDLVEKRPTLANYQHRCESRPAFQRALEAQLANFAKHAPA